MKVYGKLIFVLMLSLALVGLSGCSEKDKASSVEGKKTVETKGNTNANVEGKKTVETKGNTNANIEGKKTVETKGNTNANVEGKKSAETKGNTQDKGKKASAQPKNQEKEVHDLVLANTKIVQVSNISRRTNEQYPDLGPFFVVRGIDIRGQKSEVWIKDLKIFEMVNTK